MIKPYKYHKKDDIWKIVSLCVFCQREKCDFKTTELTGCTEFWPIEEVGAE
jgi:hypothetical protein